MRWRLIQNEWNLKAKPWTGAIGIEEDDDGLHVPGIVCWFTRGWDSLTVAKQIIEDHNKRELL